MKLLTFLGLCLILHLALAEFGSRKIPPFRPEKDEKADEVFGRIKRGVFDKIPPIVPEEVDQINGVMAGHMDKREPPKDDGQQNGINLPLLLKTHRLRPGSGDDIKRIIDDYINSHKGGNGKAENLKAEDNQNVDEPRLLGEPLIGKNRHPKKDHEIQKREVENDNADEIKLPGKNLIGKNRHPKGEKKDHDIQKREADVQNGNDDLPLLLKSHRLRPGSGDGINDIIQKYIESHKKEQEGGNVGEPELPGKNLIGKNRHPDNNNEAPKFNSVEELDADDDSDIRPLGMGLIGKFRRPPVFPVGNERVVRGNDNKQGQIECKEEDRQQVLRCFRGYFKNFDLELVDGKLPTMREIYQKFKDVKDYERQQKYFKEFSGCFKSTPETCFHANELSKISQQGEEADYLASFFTISEFSFKSKHNKKIAKCFIKQVEKCATHKGANFKECDSAKQILSEAIEKFNVNCVQFDPQPDDLKSLLSPFVKRTTLGENCPNLLSEINV